MNIELEKELVKKYPNLLKTYRTDPMAGLYHGIECEDGWLDLIESALYYIGSTLKDSDVNNVKVAQIKQKFGRLVIYLDWEKRDKVILSQLEEIEKQSENICEKCGSISGVHYTTTSPMGSGFIQVLCYGCLKANDRYLMPNPRRGW